MSWFEQLKMIPSDKNTLAFVIVNAAQTEKAVEEIKNLRTEPQTLKNLLRQVDAGTIDLQKLKDLYGQPPYGDQTLEQMKENVQKLKEAASFMTIDDVRALIREALDAKSEANQAKVDEILQRIDEEAGLQKKTLQRNRDIRDSLDILRERTGQSVIMFENPPSDEKLLANFAEAIGGELKEGSILTNLKSDSELISRMITKKGDSKETLDEKKKLREAYNAITRDESGKKTNTKMLFVSGNTSVNIDDKVREKKIFVASGQKMTVIEPFTGASVLKYLRAVDKIKGSTRAFRPKKLPNGADFPNIIFLEKGSNKSMNANPFAKIILSNEFPQDWAKPFFNAVRTQETLSDKNAFELIIDDIYNALIEGESTTKRGLNIRPFTGQDGVELAGRSRKQITADIRKKITESERLENTIANEQEERQLEQLSFLEGNFTVKEAVAYEKYLEDMGYEQGEDYTIEYFKDGVPVPVNRPKEDKEGNQIRDEEGQIVMERIDAKQEANYAEIRVDEGDGFQKVTPEEAYKEGVKAKTAEFGEKERQRYKNRLKTLQEKLDTAKEKQKQFKEDVAEETMSRSKTKIANLEKDIEQAKRILTEGRAQTDISAQAERMRQELLNMTDFEQYLLETSKRLKDKGGLIGLADRLETQSRFDSITPENSLAFFAQVDELAGDETVRKAFKTIDDNPDSTKAEEAAKELNDNMANIIQKMQDEIVEAFKLQLEKFAKNPAQFPDNQVILAKKQFVDNFGLLRLGE
tara:strand:- start:4215 stop:6470 length:2256 start_codon:yes stop_codon:yes gene_type:complete